MKKKIFAIIMIVALLTVGLSAIPIMADPSNGQLTHVKLTPENVALVTGTTQKFTVQALDENKQPVANVNYFWVVAEGGGSIDSTGLFTAGTTDATVEVIAVQGRIVKSATAEVKVEAAIGALDHIKVTPAIANVLPSGTQQFTAQGYDALGVAISVTPTWTTTATGPTGTGSISSASGLFTAGTSTGTATVTATASGKSGTATVNITINPTPTTTPAANENHDKSSLFNMFKHYLKNIGSDSFLGGTWQVKNSNGTTDTYNLISGVVQTVSATTPITLTVLPNGQTTAVPYTITTTTVIQPNDAVFVAKDKVIVLTINDQTVMVSKITADSPTQLPPGLKKNNNDNRQGKDTPPGWSQGKKNGWNKDSSNGDNNNGSNGD